MDIRSKVNLATMTEYSSFSRCGGAVYKAEEVKSHGRRYHRKCASCAACERKLDEATVNKGEDGDIYCKACYQRRYAPSGYRGTGASNWVDKDAPLRHSYQFYSF